MSMLKQRRILELCMWLFVVCAVFKFSNLCMFENLQNVVKAMESVESSEKMGKINVDDFFNVKLVGIDAFFSGSDEYEKVLIDKSAAKIIEEFDGKFFKYFRDVASIFEGDEDFEAVEKAFGKTGKGVLGAIGRDCYLGYFGTDSMWDKNSLIEDDCGELSESSVFKFYRLRQFIKDVCGYFKADDCGCYSGEIGEFLTAYSKEYNDAREILIKSPKELSKNKDEARLCFDIFKKSRVLLKILERYKASFEDAKKSFSKVFGNLDFSYYYKVFSNFVDAWYRTIVKIEVAVCGKFCDVILDVILDYINSDVSSEEKMFWLKLVGFKTLVDVADCLAYDISGKFSELFEYDMFKSQKGVE